jgi:hypothetical protein
MARQPEQATRDRAIWFVRLVTLGGVGGALGLTWGFGALAEAFFSGKPAAPLVPHVPVAAAPVQKPPPVIVSIVHHPYGPGASAPSKSGGTAARPPATKPAPAPPPPPKAICHSTPSKPC